VQAIYEANGFGARYRLHYVGETRQVRAAQGFLIGGLEPLCDVSAGDWIIVPGMESSRLDALAPPVEWLRHAGAAAARVSSVCSGAFALVAPGLLDGRLCTTHWKLTSRLRDCSPSARVLENRLFVRDGNLVTSAGEASGIDMTLALIQEDCGPAITARVAREMVVYVRRSGESVQGSIYLQYRAHTHPGVHRVQDWIVEHPQRRGTLESLADMAAVSPRHLTRVFREATGVTVTAFANKVKLEVARTLVDNRALTLEAIAGRCGFEDARQLRRLWTRQYGTTLGGSRRNHPRQRPGTTPVAPTR
jgi:transcriptional regulator GlxA family with amidase domain